MSKLDLLAIAVVARDMIDKGWTQGTWYRKAGEVEFVCTEGAIQQAMRRQIANELHFSPTVCQLMNGMTDAQSKQAITRMARILSEPREKEVFKYLCSVLGVPSIPGWNDSGHRRKEEVLALFDKLITDLEGIDKTDRSIEVEYAEVLK